MNIKDIDWLNPKTKISEHFTVHDATYLPSWQVYHKPSDEQKENVLKLAQKLEIIREYLGRPLNINCWIRPVSTNCDSSFYDGKNYNHLIGGSQNSAHIFGMAADLTVSSMGCEEARHLIVPMLEEWKVRCENKPGSNWLHLDIRELKPGGKRFFIP